MVGHLGNATDGGNLVTLICFETGFQAMTTLTTSISFTILEKQLIVHIIGPVPKITYLLTKPRTILAGNYKLGICNQYQDQSHEKAGTKVKAKSRLPGNQIPL